MLQPRSSVSATYHPQYYKSRSELALTFHIACSSLDKRRNDGRDVGIGDFVADVIREDVVVLGEHLHGTEVQVQKVRGPCRRSSVDTAIHWERQVDAADANTMYVYDGSADRIVGEAVHE